MFLGLLGYNSLMSNDCWHQIKKPILGLSPMDGITDSSFRYIQKKYGSPDVVYTEFATVEGLCRNAIRPLDDLIFDESQRPIVAQIYGKTLDFFRQTAIMVCELGFDGIDINMGCPAKNVAHSGSGAALIQTPELAQAIIKTTQAGVPLWVWAVGGGALLYLLLRTETAKKAGGLVIQAGKVYVTRKIPK